MTFKSSTLGRAINEIRTLVSDNERVEMQNYTDNERAKLEAASGVKITDDSSMSKAQSKVGELWRDIQTARDKTEEYVTKVEEKIDTTQDKIYSTTSQVARETEGLFRKAQQWCKNVEDPNVGYDKWLQDFLDLLDDIIRRGLVELYRALAECMEMFKKHAVSLVLKSINYVVENGDVEMFDAIGSSPGVGPEKIPNGKETLLTLAANAEDTDENASLLSKWANKLALDDDAQFGSATLFGKEYPLDARTIEKVSTGSSKYTDTYLSPEVRQLGKSVIGWFSSDSTEGATSTA